jgi:hypothetical protein
MYGPPKYIEHLLQQDFPPGSPQFYHAVHQAAMANALMADRYLCTCSGKRYLWPGTRIITEGPQPEWFVETLVLLCKVLNVTQRIIRQALDDFILAVPDTVENRGIRSECWHQWCWDFSWELRARVMMLDRGAHSAEHLRETHSLNEEWLRKHVKVSMATAATDHPLDTHKLSVQLRREEVLVVDHATRKLDHVRMCREAVQTSSLEIPPIPGADSAPILSLNGPPTMTPSSQEPSKESPKPLSLETRILKLKPKAGLQARLVGLMENRHEALTEELRDEVYSLKSDRSKTHEQRFKQLIYTTNDALRELEYPRQLRYTAHRIFWEPTR